MGPECKADTPPPPRSPTSQYPATRRATDFSLQEVSSTGTCRRPRPPSSSAVGGPVRTPSRCLINLLQHRGRGRPVWHLFCQEQLAATVPTAKRQDRERCAGLLEAVEARWNHRLPWMSVGTPDIYMGIVK